MANITKVKREKGFTYRIRVGNGYSSDGKQKMKSTSWTPEANMTNKQIEKELNKRLFEFEKQVQDGLYFDNIKFAKFSELWLKDYAEKQCSPKYVHESRRLLEIVNKEIGSRQVTLGF